MRAGAASTPGRPPPHEAQREAPSNSRARPEAATRPAPQGAAWAWAGALVAGVRRPTPPRSRPDWPRACPRGRGAATHLLDLLAPVVKVILGLAEKPLERERGEQEVGQAGTWLHWGRPEVVP